LPLAGGPDTTTKKPPRSGTRSDCHQPSRM
jgi:hypothetical protein